MSTRPAGPRGWTPRRWRAQALEAGVVIEPGTVHFHAKDPPRNTFRLGFSSIPVEKIAPGIQKRAQVIERMG